jgi:hypothetical protein
MATGPVVGLLQPAAATASHVGIRAVPPWQWSGMPPAAPIAVPVFGAIFLIFVCTAAFTLTATGPLTRWLPASPHTVPAIAAVAGFAAAAADLAIFILVASKLASAPAALAPRPSSPPPPPASPGSSSPGSSSPGAPPSDA